MERKAAIRSFRDLRVWQAAMDLVEQVYLLTRTFPKHEITDSQVRCSGQPCQFLRILLKDIRENTRKEYLHHFSMARASLAELETQLEIAARLQVLQCQPT